ncbi:MAG: YfhO family protein [Anaerolineae bacterium]|nr:YfhO family protein [Anaerolineae bacterium]
MRDVYNALKAGTPTVEYFYIAGLDAYDAYYAQVRNWSLTEGWWPLGMPSMVGPQSALNLLPRYAVTLEGERAGLRYVNNEGYARLGEYQAAYLNVEMYELPDSLPYTFVSTRAELATLRAHDRLDATYVEPATVISHEIDRVMVRASGKWPGEDIVVLMETNFPGWRAAVDGVPRPVVAVGNYVGVEAEFGEHTYTFWFHPVEFDIGLVVSILTLAAMAVYLIARPFRRRVFSRSDPRD